MSENLLNESVDVRCMKCDHRERTNKKVCSVCGSNIIFWKARNRDLLREFAKKWSKTGCDNLNKAIIILQKSYFGKNHPGYKIDNVLSRLKLISLLHTDDRWDITLGFI